MARTQRMPRLRRRAAGLLVVLAACGDGGGSTQAVRDSCGTISAADPRGANDAWRCRTDLAAKLNRSRDAVLAGLGSSGTDVAAR